MQNKQRSIYTPLILSVVLILGVAIGVYFGSYRSKNTSMFANIPVSKFEVLMQLINENYVDSINKDELTEAAIVGMLKKLDPHSVYLPPVVQKSATEHLEGNFEGIGVQFNMQNDTVFVVNTIPGGPSDKVGILAGDRIITINDSLFAGVGVDSDDIIKNLKGKQGTKVNVGIKRHGTKELLEFEIERDKIPLYSIDIAYMLTSEIGYVKITSFGRTTHDEFLKASKELKEQGMTKLVVDLRDNGGGYLKSAIALVDEFLSEDKMIVYTEGRTRRREEYFSTDKGNDETTELVILIDSWSASASEILAGAIQDNDRGTIVGRRSFGKGLVQEPIMFRDESSVRLTIARYYTPTGRSIQKTYDKGTDQYNADIYNRSAHGEMYEIDSTYFADSLQFVTPKGKIVYGGGGIMPDVFVPVDTSYYSNYYKEIASRGLIYYFALEYADKNRERLSKFTESKQFERFLKTQNLLSKFVAFAEQKGLKTNTQELAQSKVLIHNDLLAYITRNVIDNKGFYPIIHKTDPMIKKAIEILK